MRTTFFCAGALAATMALDITSVQRMDEISTAFSLSQLDASDESTLTSLDRGFDPLSLAQADIDTIYLKGKQLNTT